MSKPLLFDLEPLSCGCTDHVLETMYKSMSDPPDGDMLWKPHHDPYVRDHIEDVTRRGQKILLAIQTDLIHRIGGEPIQKLQAGKGLLAKAGGWMRWNKKQLDDARKQIESKEPADYTIDDWMLLVDWLVQKYLPADVITADSEYLAVRSVLAGKVQANMDAQKPGHKLIGSVIAMLPEGKEMIPFTLNDLTQSVIDFASARAAELISDLGDNVRHRIKQIILQHESLAAANDPEATLWNLQSKMLDEFGILNRDWRRVAMTEVVRNANEGFIAGLPEGTRVRRVEAYDGACNFCRKINGLEFVVVSASKEDKDGNTEIWVGKTNVDRSSSPRKRVGDELIERTPAEMWWPAAGVQHPNCRGSWVLVVEKPPEVEQEFVDWLDGVIEDDKRGT